VAGGDWLIQGVVFLTMSEWETRKRKKFAAKDGPRINKGPRMAKITMRTATMTRKRKILIQVDHMNQEGQEEGPTNKYGDDCVERSDSEESEKDIVVIPDEPLTEIGTPAKLGSIARLPILEHWALEGGKKR
jgi:hypothetical protein